MDERDQERQLVDALPAGTGRLRAGVEMARGGVEDAAWLLREHLAWPLEDGLERLGRRGAIGVFGGGGTAVAGVVAALVIAGSGGGGGETGATEAFAPAPRAPVPAAVTPAAKPKQKAKPAGPTLHGAPPNFAPAQDVKAGVGDGKALGGKEKGSGGDEAPARRGAAHAGAAANEAPAATAKIGSSPAATASAATRADGLAAADQGAAGTEAAPAKTGAGAELGGPPAPKAAKRVARRFAEAFVVYEIGGIDGKVRQEFDSTSTKQLARSLLHRPPRQPASVKVPQAKVVNVVAGPSRGSVYTVSVSLLRVGVTSELRLEMERGVGKKWQVTNVLG